MTFPKALRSVLASLAIILVAAAIYAAVVFPFPVSHVWAGPQSQAPQGRYFSATGCTVGGPFLNFFDRHGGLRLFGYPISGVVTEDGRPVQYFERQRFEYHSEYAGTDYEVELSRLGAQMAPASALSAPGGPSSPGTVYVPETGRKLGAPFLAFWRANGDVRIFGYPISEAVTENGLRVQYFERARMEYHPEKAQSGFAVELGLLGKQYRDARAAASRGVSPTSRGGTSAVEPVQTAGLSDKESGLLSRINQARQAAGIPAVTVDPSLRNLALSRSRDMVTRNYFSHTNPDGKDFLALLAEQKVSFHLAGEILANNNYADGQTTELAFASFMNSPHHHDILMDPRYNLVGVGEAANERGFHYFTVIFIQK